MTEPEIIYPGKYKRSPLKKEGAKTLCCVHSIMVPNKLTSRKNATTQPKRVTVIISLTGHDRTACPATFDLT